MWQVIQHSLNLVITDAGRSMQPARAYIAAVDIWMYVDMQESDRTGLSSYHFSESYEILHHGDSR
jgi:hypothetical protein